MKIIDIISIVIIALGGLIGFKKGAIKTIVGLVGFFLITIIAYKLKNPLASLFIKHLPLFDVGSMEGLKSLSLLVYHGLSFLIIFALLYGILSIILKVTGLIDLIVKMTVILEIPSKIIGLILGLIEGVIVVFIFAFVLMQFGPTQKEVMESTITLKIVENTPIMGKLFNKGIETSKEIYNIIIDNNDKDNIKDVNEKITNLLIEGGIISEKDIENITSDDKEDKS